MSFLIIDLSNNNTITANAFPLLKLARVMCMYHKASQGLTFSDAFFSVREQLAERAGFRVGPYHWAEPHNHTPKEEAEHFLSRYRGHDDMRSLKVALDMEDQRAAKLGRRLIQWSRDWNKIIRDELGHWPAFYSSPYFISRVMGMTVADKPIGGALWLAAYGSDDGVEHPFFVPPPWRKADAHQFTSKAHLPGVVGPVDLSSAPRLRPLLAHPVMGRL